MSQLEQFLADPKNLQRALVYGIAIFVILLLAFGGTFVIPAGQLKTFRAEYRMPADVSLISVLPHAHLLGKSWKVWAVKPSGDTIRIIKINDWDFNWQGSYRLPNLVKIPANSRIFAEATYDNRASNPRNPFSPPQSVTWGEETTAEMFLCYFDFVVYRPGDENLVLSAQTEKELFQRPTTRLYPLYPNPAGAEGVTLGFSLARPAPVTLTLTDAQGRIVRRILQDAAYGAGPHQLTVPTTGLAGGLYQVRLRTPDAEETQKLTLLK